MTQVREVDPHGPDLDAWAGVQAASLLHDRPDDPPPPVEEVRAGALAGLPARDPSERVRLFVAVESGVPVGAGRLELPLRDNTHLAYVEVHVRPDARRRGVGTELLAVLERAAGRDLLTSDLDEPPALLGTSPGRRALERAGFLCALIEVRRDLLLPVPEERLARLEAEAAPHAQGYRVVTWRDRCPDDLVEGRAALGRVMSVDAPLGSLDVHEEVWDAARVRERERLLGEQGRASVVAAALHAGTGELVAFSELAARPALPSLVEQWETLVLSAHRGRRLGTLVKTAALRRLAVEVPQAQRVVTVNADTNAWMIAVNERLGFVPNGASTSWQRERQRARQGAGLPSGRR